MAQHTDIAIIGTGFSGLGMAIRLKQAGVEDFVVLERAGDIGGTWRDNTYPGCQCDVPSHLYSFSFAPNPDWSRTYSPQPEIGAYLRRCAERFGILPHVRFRHEVRMASWDDDARLWRLETSSGALTARVLVAGFGPLSEPARPAIPGLDEFPGPVVHTAEWDPGVDLAGKRVAVIGTGASAIQAVPRIQRAAARMHVFQRTPPWIMRHTDRPISTLERQLYRRVPAAQRLVRAGVYCAREALVPGFVRFPRLMKGVERLARAHLRRQVRDPALRAKLTPDYSIGCKRILLSNDYYPALTRPNAELVTDAIAEVRGSAIVTADGAEREVDAIVLGTGFRVTDLPFAERVRGRAGRTLAATWDGSLEAHNGTAVAGFPNLFLLLGPNTGLGHSSMVYMAESQIAYVLDALRVMRERGDRAVEVRPEAQARYVAEVQRRMRGTVWTNGGCASWYIDARGRNSTLWPGSTFSFRRRTRCFDIESYALTPARPVPRAPELLAAT